MKKRLLALFLLLVLCAGLLPTAAAVGVDDPCVFTKQQTRSTCTLASATMMLRRRAILDLDADWSGITESAVRKRAWSGGLAWNFTYNGMSVSVLRKASGWGGSSLEEKKAYLIDMLDAHPEGIVAYDTSKPHAVLLTDYDADTDTFYCADPAAYYPSGRIPLAQCSNNGSGQDGKLKNISQLWYISSGLSSGAGTMAPAQEDEPSRDQDAQARLSTQDIRVNGQVMTFQVYVLENRDGNESCYVNISDLAAALSGTTRQFDVVLGEEETVLFSGVAYPYTAGVWDDLPLLVPAPLSEAVTRLDGALRELDNIQVTDDQGVRHIYYKLRDLGDALDFTVDWDAQQGTRIDTELA